MTQSFLEKILYKEITGQIVAKASGRALVDDCRTLTAYVIADESNNLHFAAVSGSHDELKKGDKVEMTLSRIFSVGNCSGLESVKLPDGAVEFLGSGLFGIPYKEIISYRVLDDKLEMKE